MNKEKRTVGQIHSFESFGTVDGPGVRFVVFVQGCALRCLYCHNPDTIEVKEGEHQLTAEQVVEKIEKFRSFYKTGGITISGGEPLLQENFLIEVFTLCKERGIHTTLDTSGFRMTDKTKKVLAVTDLVLLDIKCIDSKVYKMLTNQPLKPTLDFAKYLSDQEIPVWIRYVLVPGITDDPILVEKHAEFVASLKNVEKVEILPFHKMGQAKYDRMGIEFPLKNTRVPTAEEVKRVKAVYEGKGLRVN